MRRQQRQERQLERHRDRQPGRKKPDEAPEPRTKVMEPKCPQCGAENVGRLHMTWGDYLVCRECLWRRKCA